MPESLSSKAFACLILLLATQAEAHDFTDATEKLVRVYPMPEQEKKAFGQMPEGPRNALRGVLDSLKVWPVGLQLSACFTGGAEPLRQFFVETTGVWSEAGNIGFDFGSAPHFRDCQPLQPSQIRIAFADDGNWSYVGTDSMLPDVQKKPSLNIGDAAGRDFALLRQDHLRGVILHELGHALGLEHENQSPESRCEEEFDWPAVYKELGEAPNNWSTAEVDSNMRVLVKEPRLRVTPYDRKSIMHYALPAWMFRAREQSKCFVPENLVLSDGDRAIIRAAYPVAREQQQSYLTASGEHIKTLLHDSGITQEQAKVIAELAKAIVGQSYPDIGFAIRVDNIRKEENKQEGLEQKIEGSCNIGVQGTQDSNNFNIQGGCNK